MTESASTNPDRAQLTALRPSPEPLAYIPGGLALQDASRVARAIAHAFPNAVARTVDLPSGMAMGIFRDPMGDTARK